ncbi:MAG: rRNA maturation RNase YbeY [Ardenticatenales bacterium]|nr:rRNA maturation RNase YbeY [Ardenticatenales bacterium]
MEDERIQIQVDPRWVEQVNLSRLEQAIQAVFGEIEGLGNPALSLVIVGDEEMIRLHETYRGEAGSTDVLTFPYEEEEEIEEMADYLGDILVCYEQAARQAEEEGHSVHEELELLAVHGTLHLLGYDDETPEEKQEMWEQQRTIMGKLGLGKIAPPLEE